MFDEQYEQLRNAEKEDFAHVVNTLMLKSFILRDYYDRNAKTMRSSKEYAFIDRNFELVSDIYIIQVGLLVKILVMELFLFLMNMKKIELEWI